MPAKSTNPEGKRAQSAWVKYYHERRTDVRDMTLSSQLTCWQRHLVAEVTKEIVARSKFEDTVRLWSAGSGIDVIGLRLKKRFRKSLDLTILDVSRECIDLNRKLFDSAGLDAEFAVCDIFDCVYVRRFDIVMNSGLLEHFGRGEQEKLLSIFSRSLKPGGVYLTLTPFKGGRLYNLCRRKMVAKHRWALGPEEPVESLTHLRGDDLVLEEEYPVAAVDQFRFVRPAFPALGTILLPITLLLVDFDVVTDPIMRRIIGGYCLFDKFVKKKE